MRNIKLTISYDGSNYSGWQIQPNGITIQELIQNAVRKMTGEENNVVASGRTDAGVHALGQVASFRTEKDISLDGFKMGLNSSLPKDIRILNTEVVSESFHPIRDSKSKHYRYVIAKGNIEDPINVNRAWLVAGNLNLPEMNKALSTLVGKHDYTSFRAADASDENAVREIYKAECHEMSDSFYGKRFEIDIVGSGFLKNMVRNIVGTLLDVGKGKITSEDFGTILEAKDRKKAGVCAPASGLYLVSVEY